jgi:hypothetical protein
MGKAKPQLCVTVSKKMFQHLRRFVSDKKQTAIEGKLLVFFPRLKVMTTTLHLLKRLPGEVTGIF